MVPQITSLAKISLEMKASLPFETPLSTYQSRRCHIQDKPNLMQPQFTSHFDLSTLSPIKHSIHCTVTLSFLQTSHNFFTRERIMIHASLFLNVSFDVPFRRRSWTNRYWLLGETTFDLFSWYLQTHYLRIARGNQSNADCRKSWVYRR